MFGKNNGLMKKKNVNSKRYKRDMAERLNGKSIKCVTERINGIEEVIGRSGAIISKDGELIVFSSKKVVFRTKIEDMSAWELLSLEGVVITAPDMEHGGEERTIIAYYTYWRKTEE